MSKPITVIRGACPRIEAGTPAGPERFMDLLTQRTTLSAGVVKNVQESELETLIGLLLEGQTVHTGTAIYTPSIDLEGNFQIHVRPDARLVRALNAPKAFRGVIINAENIGKTSAEIFAEWDAQHPNDPVVP